MPFWTGIVVGALISWMIVRARIWVSHRAYLLGFAKEYGVVARRWETNRSLTDRCAKALVDRCETELSSACDLVVAEAEKLERALSGRSGDPNAN